MISPEDLIKKLGVGTDDAACVQHLLDEVNAHKPKHAAPVGPDAHDTGSRTPPPPPPVDDDDDKPHAATKRR